VLAKTTSHTACHTARTIVVVFGVHAAAYGH